MEEVSVFTDGSCLGNPGPGGWAVLLRFRDTDREISGGAPETTNNRMELMAVIEGLAALKRPCHVTVHTDSQYVKNGMTAWIRSWKKNGFRTASGSPVKNEPLWRELDRLATVHQMRWVWVRGHDGHTENERVDALARAAAEKMRGSLD